jgi:hypothetical protein
MGMMGGLFMMAGFVMLCCLGVVVGRLGVMLGRVPMMLGCLLGHEFPPFGDSASSVLQSCCTIATPE